MQIFQQLQPISKKDRVIDVVRSAIVRGDLAPGELIVETRLARQFGVGQPLVREALIELEHAGFVQRVPYRGTYVTQLSMADIENIFRLRAELEAIAAGWAKERATPDDIAALQAIVAGMREAARMPDLERFYAHDLAFHRKIWDIAGNPYLTESLERVVSPLFAFFLMKNPRVAGTYDASAESHARIVAALETAPAATVRQLTHEALLQFKDEWNARAQ